MLRCTDLTVSVGDRLLVRDLSLELNRGSVLGILGENGSGKTSTLHTLAGLRKPQTGSVQVNSIALPEIPGGELARQLGLLMQNEEDPFPMTVMDAAIIGRHPHIGFWGWEGEQDYTITRDVLASLDLDNMDMRLIETLSGGERRRLAIATVLVQDPDTLLLDEPINHLDPHHQLGVLRLLRARAETGKAVALSLHDAHLAHRFCDTALLLFGDGEWQFGPADSVLTADNLSRLYRIDVRAIPWRDGSREAELFVI